MKAAKQPGTEGRRQCDSAHARRPEQADPETGGRRAVAPAGGRVWLQASPCHSRRAPPSLICHSAIRMLMKVMM